MVWTLAGCGAAETANNRAQNAKNEIDEVKDSVEMKVVDKLDCSGTISQETRTLISDALTAADFDPEELVTTPEELARFVGAVAVSTDTTAMLLGNVAQIARIGHMGAAHAGAWDTLICGESTAIACTDTITDVTRGLATSVVECDNATPGAVRVSFDDACTLFVTENAGSISYRRSDGAYAFDDFALGSVRQVDGLLAVSLESDDGLHLAVGEMEGISVATNEGKSCEERLTISRLIADAVSTGLSVDIDAERLADDKTMSIATPVGAATFSNAAPCTCPDPGSVIDWRWTGFIKGQGDANLRLSYAAATKEGACADVSVKVMSWPAQCDGAATDCGKSAVEKLLGPLVAATCVPR